MMPMQNAQFEAMLMQVTQPRGWMMQRDMQGNLQITVPNAGRGRPQTVYVTYGVDSEQAQMAFFWSICAEVNVLRDPMVFLRANVQLSYGAYAIRDPHLIIQEGLYLGGADPNTIAKIIWHVAKNADESEQVVYGHMQRF